MEPIFRRQSGLDPLAACGEWQLGRGAVSTCEGLMVVRLSAIDSSLRPASDPNAKRLYSGVLERSDQPVCVRFYDDIGLIRSLSPSSDSMNQRNSARERGNAFDFRRQSGTFKDTSEKRTVKRAILLPPAQMHPVEGDVVRLLGKTLGIGCAIATRPRVVQAG